MNPQFDREITEALKQRSGLIHPIWGDLSRGDAVRLPGIPRVKGTYRERRPYCVHLSVTGRCNARCAGCVNSSITFRHSDDPARSLERDTKPQRDALAILKLLTPLREEEVVLAFYGGEPFLLPEKMQAIVTIFSSERHRFRFQYMVYSNGQLLANAIERYPELLSRIWLYAISIDGTREQHNRERVGTDLEIIHSNLARLRPLRRGPVLIWSTLREGQSLADCFKEFLSLHEQSWADLFFWHWQETDQPFDSFPAYAARYEEDLRNIMETYLAWLSRGKLLPIVHLNELILYLLTGRNRGSSACGVELARNLDLVGGRILACADLPPEFALGTIEENGEPIIREMDLRSLVRYKEDIGCYECGVHPYCGGRCPIQALTGSAIRVWQYCQLMRIHVGTITQALPLIERLLPISGLNLQDLYDRAAFYAQFTDVTP